MTLDQTQRMIHSKIMRSFLVILFLCLALPALASNKAELKKIEADLHQQQDLQKEYASAHDDIEKKLEVMRGELVSATREVQIHERALLKVQQNRQETEEQITTAKDKLQAQRKSLAQLVLALQRLDRLPPQALLARPSAPIDTARSFYLLQHVMPDISKRAAEVKTTLDQLASLQSTYDTQEASLQKENDELTLKRGILQKSLNQRQALLKQTEKNQNAATRKAEALAKQAEDLRDLMSSLSKTEASVPKSSFGSSVKSWFGGKSTLPVEGKVKIGYGDTMPGGGQSQGLSIAAASGAIVTAPSDGIVRFAGPFRQYKLLVIIQHNNGEHSLLGGLQEIYTRTGEKVAAGEPVGKLPAKIEGGDTQQASLYYERRRNGKPIDPRNARG